ncbi:MAG TPA: Rhs element Vgr protein [Telluria sp.]|nr:Rhs element Vgr protein [Telluria sp.]
MTIARPLTAGEIAMASALFGAAIDYARVRVVNRPYLPFGLQSRNTAMAPNGKIYFHHSCYLDDFSAGDEHARHWFIHEMVHVWQHQLGYPVRLRGAIRLGLSYRYELGTGKTLADFNMEAQGDLLADYFALKHLGSTRVMRQRRYADSLPLFESVLRHFTADPASGANLHRGISRHLRRARR